MKKKTIPLPSQVAILAHPIPISLLTRLVLNETKLLAYFVIQLIKELLMFPFQYKTQLSYMTPTQPQMPQIPSTQ